MSRLRDASRAPLAAAVLFALPLFFAALMAMSLALEKPSVHHILRHGRVVTRVGDPSGATEASIWLVAAAVPLVMVVVGALAVLVGRRGTLVSAAAAIAVAIVLLVPLDGWARAHAARYPVGVDLIPPSAGSQDVYLRGEWEASARRTARQLGFVAIGMAALTIVGSLALDARRRRPAVPAPPPEGAQAPGATPSGLTRL